MRFGGLKIKWQMLLLGAKEALRTLRVRLRGEEPDRRRAALTHVQHNVAANNPAALLDALDEFGRNNRFLMNVGDMKGPLLKSLVAALPAQALVVELGAFVGYSAVMIASVLPPGARLISLEKDAVSAQVARAMVAHAGLSDRVEVRCGDTLDLIPALEGPCALVFIDHWKDVYKRDLQALERHGLLRPGSVVVADNVGPMFDAREYLDYVRKCGRYSSRYEVSTVEYTDIEDGVEISVFNS